MCEKQLLDVQLKKCGGLEAGSVVVFVALTILGFTRVRSGLVHSMDLHKIQQMFEKIFFVVDNFHICMLTFVLLLIS